MITKKPLMFYDMDNTIAEMSEALVGINSKELNDYYHVNSEEIQETLHKRGFFKELAIIGTARATIEHLVEDKGYDVRILSQPMVNGYCIDEKNYWLDNFLPCIPRHKRIYTFDKWLVAGEGRLLVDDNISHLTQWEEYGGIGICFQRGYNKNWRRRTITDHDEIFQVLEALEKAGRKYF